jgi:hypothetical protein
MTGLTLASASPDAANPITSAATKIQPGTQPISPAGRKTSNNSEIGSATA